MSHTEMARVQTREGHASDFGEYVVRERAGEELPS